jgi:RimJ/RimL family protein N-acetyltransferase
VKTFQTERLLFRPHELADLEAYCTIEADPAVSRFSGGVPVAHEAAAQRFQAMFLTPLPDQIALWAVVLKSTQRYVGYFDVAPHLYTDGTAIAGEGIVGVTLARDCWRTGLATEGGRAFLAHIAADLQLHRVVAAVEAGNAASLRLMQKLGFREEWRATGTRRSIVHLACEAPVCLQGT